jgi:hypothetical protein
LIKSQTKPAAAPAPKPPSSSNPVPSAAPAAAPPVAAAASPGPSTNAAPKGNAPGAGEPTPGEPAAAEPAAAEPGASSMATLPAGQLAAATLLGLLKNPAVQQSLLSQILGPSGNQQVVAPSGATLPRAAINGLLTQLLSNASDSLPEYESITEQSWLRDATGEYLVDPASPDQVGALVLSHLQYRSPARPGRATGNAYQWLDVEGSDEAVEFY